MKKCEVVTVKKYTEKGKTVVIVDNISSGMVTHFGDGDSGSVKFQFDASRFDVRIRCVKITKGQPLKGER